MYKLKVKFGKNIRNSYETFETIEDAVAKAKALKLTKKRYNVITLLGEVVY